MDYPIQVITRQAGFTLDVDYHPADDFRVVQLTAPGSACSVQVGVGLTDAPWWPARRAKQPWRTRLLEETTQQRGGTGNVLGHRPAGALGVARQDRGDDLGVLLL
jgi:hypothetical protein